MLFWILMAAMTAAASLAVLAPLGRRPTRAEGSARSIYRDQLDELERERGEGLIGAGEAEAARLELARRLLRTESGDDADGGDGRRSAIIGFVAAAVLVPAVALGAYLVLGSPALPDRPLSARDTAIGADADIATLIGRVEAHLREQPEDGSGWEILGPVYARLGRHADAVRAFGNANRLLGPNADREALLGEAITVENGGIVTADARAAFDRALALDPNNVRAGYYRAVGLGQGGDRDAAVAAWDALIVGAPADAPWLASARAERERLQDPPRGPSAADMAEAAQRSPEDQQAMIEGMVSGLAARLDADPGDTEGWARLFRAYMVLGRPDEARAALARAREALAGEPDMLSAVEKAATENGIAGGVLDGDRSVSGTDRR